MSDDEGWFCSTHAQSSSNSLRVAEGESAGADGLRPAVTAPLRRAASLPRNSHPAGSSHLRATCSWGGSAHDGRRTSYVRRVAVRAGAEAAEVLPDRPGFRGRADLERGR